MNKMKLVFPLATLLVLTSCGVKTKEVKTIWGNTWGYTDTVYVGFRIEERQKIQTDASKIDWEQTRIVFGNDISDVYYEKNDQSADNILSADFIHYCNYPVVAKQRDFFKDNKIVVSSKEEKTVTIGKNNYSDAKEANGTEQIGFNNGASLLASATDNEGIIQHLSVKHVMDGGAFTSNFDILVYFTGEEFPVEGQGFFEIAALA
ncbi:MAG: hypothetical protein MJ208_01735 [Bacilli bacterium]|nr:hypothetical protein [Bacilli bacterium]